MPLPIDAKIPPESNAISPILRVFYFSILRPYMRLVERSLRNVLVDPEFNDICLATTELSVACFHYPEWLKLQDKIAADNVRGARHFVKIGDIANTQKHGLRQNAQVQVTTRARMAFIVNEEGKFGFFRTEVMSHCPKWGDLDAIVAIGEFIEDLVAIIGFNNGQIAPLQWTAPTAYHDECLVLFTEDSFTAASTDFRAYRLEAGGILKPVEEGFEISLRMEVDVPAQVTMGKWTLQYDLSALQTIAASNNGEI
jgi:hypothetical protein